MKLLLFTLAVLPFLIGCADETVYSHKEIRAEVEFNSEDVRTTERLINRISTNWKLEYIEKDRERMSFLSRGEVAFFIFLLHKDESILSLQYTGDTNILNIVIVDYKTMPLLELEKLMQEVMQELELEFVIDFQEIH